MAITEINEPNPIAITYGIRNATYNSLSSLYYVWFYYWFCPSPVPVLQILNS